MNNKPWLQAYEGKINAEVEIPNKSVPNLLFETVQRFGDHEAISFYGTKFTYQQVLGIVSAFAGSLQKRGVQKGDRMAIMLPNCPQYVFSYYGALTMGAIVTQINPMLVERELEYILKDSDAESIVIYEPLLPRLLSVQDRTNIKNIVVVSLQPTNTDFSTATRFEDFLKEGGGTYSPVEIDPENDLAVLQYTGGTTGRSKGAMLTHRNLVANTVQSFEFFKNDYTLGKEKCLTVIPLFHVFGMTSCMNLTIYGGGSLIMLPRFDVEEMLETIKREQPTVFPGVPTMYVAITNHPKAEDYGIDCIRICNSGSAPMPVELLREFERKTGAKILEGYGLSEASPTTHCNPMFAERKPGSIGIGLPSTDYKVVDVATGTMEVPVGELGEIIISGPQVMKGYWNMPDETAVTLRDGWLYTGDIAKMDEDGYIYIMDRKKDMIIAGGFNIYPRDVEEVIYEHPAVQEAVVIGVADPYRGETVKAFIVFKTGKSVTEEEMIEYCRENMSAYKVPRIIEFRDQLPKTSVGKILRRALREEASPVN